MNLNKIIIHFTKYTYTVGVLFLFLACSYTQTKGPTGLWKYVCFEQMDSTLNWQPHEWMLRGTGYIYYSQDGLMYMHIVPYKYYNLKKPRAHIGISDSIHAPLHAWFNEKDSVYTLANYTYTAAYTFKHDTLFHKKISSGNPENLGEIVKRRFECLNDTLILYPINRMYGYTRIKFVKTNVKAESSRF